MKIETPKGISQIQPASGLDDNGQLVFRVHHHVDEDTLADFIAQLVAKQDLVLRSLATNTDDRSRTLVFREIQRQIGPGRISPTARIGEDIGKEVVFLGGDPTLLPADVNRAEQYQSVAGMEFGPLIQNHIDFAYPTNVPEPEELPIYKVLTLTDIARANKLILNGCAEDYKLIAVSSGLAYLESLWLGQFFDSLAHLVSPERTVAALTGDHGVSPLPEYSVLVRHKPAGRVWLGWIAQQLQTTLAARFQTDFGVNFDNGLLSADVDALKARGINVDSLAAALASEANAFPGVARVFTPAKLARAPVTDADADVWRRLLPPDYGWLFCAMPKPGYVWAGGSPGRRRAP